MVIYVPQTNSIGVDEFSFIIVGPEDFAVDLAGMIEVIPVNDPPTAGAFSAVTEANTPVIIDLIADDPDTDVLHFGLVEWPIHGTLSGDPPNLVYHPAPDFEGADQFSYRADDGELQSAEVNVGLTIVPLQVEDALRPVLANVTVSMAGLTLTWSAIPGFTYRVIHRADPAVGEWMNASLDLLAESSVLTCSVEVPINPCFYAIRVIRK